MTKGRSGKKPSSRNPARVKPATAKRTKAKPATAKRTKAKPAKAKRTKAKPKPAKAKRTKPELAIRSRSTSLRREIGRLIQDDDRLMHLLRLEKARRGVGPDDLVFIGMHNVAQTTWCPMQAVLKSRQNELEFFSAYLSDRVRHAVDAKLVTRVPKEDDELLAIGSDLTLKMVEDLDRRREAKDKQHQRTHDYTVELVMPEPDPDDYKALGSYLEHRHAEEYPTTRWNFQWEGYVIVGIPDGLTDEFAYEFKTAKKRYFLSESKATAFAQADLYGYFYDRPLKRVQMLVREDGGIETWQESVDRANAERVLRILDSVQRGEVRPALPPLWKCRSCEFKNACPLLESPSGWGRII